MVIADNRVAIVTTGDEIMAGNVVDTNFSWLADHCWRLGLNVVYHVAVADEKSDIGAAIQSASSKASVVIITGGLGPTEDDKTMEALAEAFNKKMHFDDTIWKEITTFLTNRGRSVAAPNKKQAYLPESGVALPNRVGTAPGVQIRLNGAECFLLPGVPSEMKQIFRDSVWPWLQQQASKGVYHERLLKCFGLPEATIAERIEHLSVAGVRLSYRVKFPDTWFKLLSREKGAGDKVNQLESLLRAQLGDYMYGADDDSMESVVVALLAQKRKRLAVAESCTGGQIAHLLTNVPGASKVFERAMVTYSNRSKSELLDVDPELIATHGAVSRQVAEAMAVGAQRNSHADYALAVTGIAGPGWATEQKPVGTVYIALAHPNGVISSHYLLHHERRSFKLLAAYYAIDMVRRELLEKQFDKVLAAE